MQSWKKKMRTELNFRLKAACKHGVGKAKRLFYTPFWVTKPSVFSFLVGISILPVCAAFWVSYLLLERSNECQVWMQKLEHRAQFLMHMQQKREAFFKTFAGADRDFLQTTIAKQELLNEDIDLLKRISSDETYVQYEPIRERLSDLRGEKNKMCFVKKQELVGDFYEEQRWSLQHFVEMSSEDVKQVVSEIEGVRVDSNVQASLRPYLVVTKFALNWKAQENKNQLFSVDMEVLQRGCHSRGELL